MQYSSEIDERNSTFLKSANDTHEELLKIKYDLLSKNLKKNYFKSLFFLLVAF